MKNLFTLIFLNIAAICNSVNAQPCLVLSTTAGTRCGYGTVTLAATASPGATLNWYDDFSGVNPIGGGTVFTTPLINTTTTYFVEAVSSGCQSSLTPVTATVTVAPNITISATPQVICSGSCTTLNATSVNPDYSYDWQPGLFSGASISPCPTSSTIYTVTGTDANSLCVATKIIAISVTSLPQPQIVESSKVICSNSNVASGFFIHVKDIGAYIGGYPVGTLFEWVGYAAATAGMDELFVNASGDYTCIVYLPASLGGCAITSNTIHIEFSTTAVYADIKFNYTQNTNCSQNGKLKAIIQNGTGAYTYDWFDGIGNSISSVPGNPTTAAIIQCNTYAVNVTDANTCVTHRSYMIPRVNLTQPTNCKAQATVLCNTDFGSPASYKWNNNTLLNSNPLNCIVSGTPYYVIISNANGDNIKTCSKSYTVAPLNFVGFDNTTASRLAVKVSGGCKPYTATWSIDGGSINPVNFPYAAVVNGKIKHLPGNHVYSVTVTDDCGHSVSSSFSPRFSEDGSSIEIEPSSGLTVFPNPTSGIFTISFNDDLQNEKSDISIYNSTGQLILNSKNAIDNSNQLQIDLSNQPKGIYCVKVNVNGVIMNQKVLVE